MKNIRIRAAAAALSLVCLAASPMTALAEGPQFAHDEATWARLRDNVMEYDELQMLVEEYNPYYLNNQGTYQQGRSVKDKNEIRQTQYDNASDLADSAEDLRDTADTMKDALEMMSDMAVAVTLDSATKKQISGMSSAYASLMAAAAMIEQSSVSTRQSADASYEDSETQKLAHQNTQTGLVVQTQGLFASYNLARKSLGTMQQNLALAEQSLAMTQRQQAVGLATATDVLKAQNSVQSLQSGITSTEANVENLRQQLCLATGWKYNDQPVIEDLPKANAAIIAGLNPDVDAQTAVDNNISLKINRRLLANMEEGSTEKRNMERTIANQEQNIRSSVRTMYNTVVMDNTALQAAQAALVTETKNMSIADTKMQLGMISSLEYLNAQSSLASRQIELETADMNLQQALESYQWAMNGYIASVQ
ncbi:MAG: TolC family protein [Clostridium sp.]|nr:TolC family protein [Clostridium sp.]